ncbi:DUF3159 domain-containing protein [Streptomyces sp. NPDC048172]|uniref:DUF3159 domain-containing protein n=1 Tax=Streptomyces sp. NPDC048172 TaxID=3365505 RepID=UPI0037149312
MQTHQPHQPQQPQQPQQPPNEAAEAPKKRPTVLEQIGGTKGAVYSVIPVIAFVLANNSRGLKFGIIAAFVAAGAVALERLRTKETLQPALGGVLGVAVAAGVSWYTGSAKDFFLIGIWASLGGAILFLASVLVRWPLAGLLWNSATGKGTLWRADKRSRLYYDIATLTLTAVFGARFAVQYWLYETDQVSSLGFAKVLMGYPLLGLALLVVAWAARCSNKRLKAVGLLPTGPTGRS